MAQKVCASFIIIIKLPKVNNRRLDENLVTLGPDENSILTNVV
jgi:hypothetical protein